MPILCKLRILIHPTLDSITSLVSPLEPIGELVRGQFQSGFMISRLIMMANREMQGRLSWLYVELSPVQLASGPGLGTCRRGGHRGSVTIPVRSAAVNFHDIAHA